MKLGPGCICHPVLGVSPLQAGTPGFHETRWTKRSESPSVCTTAFQNCGSWVWTCKEILPNVAFESVSLLKHGGGVAGVARTGPAYAATAATAATARTRAPIHRLRIALPAFECPSLDGRAFRAITNRRIVVLLPKPKSNAVQTCAYTHTPGSPYMEALQTSNDVSRPLRTYG